MMRTIYTVVLAAAVVLCLWLAIAVAASLFVDLGPDVDEHGPKTPPAQGDSGKSRVIL